MASENESATSTEEPDEHITEHKHGGLGQWAATAICGNDITSSCLYVSALAILMAGQYAPIALLMVAGLLFLFRSIYAEVVGALPLNGGAYNALLNTTSKFRASFAACLTILSYMASAVLSANEAIHYLSSLWPDHWAYWTLIGVTIGLLGTFMVLTIIGISESAVVAIGIFIIHMSSLALLLIVGIIYIAMTGIDTLAANWNAPTEIGFLAAIFFGFSAALLGISGFESSANFVEEQAEGVFPKTLRNMWVAVSIFNPAIALLALAIIPIGDINDANKNALLADIGQVVGHGPWLAYVISIDAVLVLSGAVLTSFVGVTGLVNRMALDRCLPQFLLKRNRRGTTHRIIIAFVLLCVSVLLITQGELEALAGVYTLSFLAVMALFCVGNILLKVRREKLPRPTRAPWMFVVVALVAVTAGLVGNAIVRKPAKLFYVTKQGMIEEDATFQLAGPHGERTIEVAANEPLVDVAERVNAESDRTGVSAEVTKRTLVLLTEEIGSLATISIHVTDGHFKIAGKHGDHAETRGIDGYANLLVFFQYFVPTVLIVSIMLGRITLLKALLFVVRGAIGALIEPMRKLTQGIREKIDEINSQQMVFFTRGDNIANLNNAMSYVRDNEHTNRIKVVTVVRKESDVPDKLREDIEFLDDAFPKIDIEFVVIEGKFGPELIDKLSKEWKIPKNFMFIGSPGDHFLYGLAELGGVRLII